MRRPTTLCSSVRYGLRVAGIWPNLSWSRKVLHRIYWITFTGAFQVYQYKYIFMQLDPDNVLDFVDNLSIAMPFSLTLIKLVISWLCQGVLRDLLSTMEEDCQKYAVIDKNNAILKTANLSGRLSCMIMSLYIISVVFYTAGAFVAHMENGTMSRELVLRMDLPFEVTEPPVYELVVTVQFLHQTLTAFTYSVFGALLLMLILHVGCQIDILCGIFADISAENTKPLKFLVKRHREIILFTERIEKLFSYIAFSQLVSNTLIICFVGFLIVASIKTENGLPVLIKSVLFYVVLCVEAFIFCFAGEYLNIKSKMMSEAAYGSLWYDLHPKDSRFVVLLILRSQRGFTLTFGKFSNMSLENFTGMMKLSASYMSVLLAMS